MSNWSWAFKLASEFGATGVLIVGLTLLYRLTDKWAALFLDAQKAQAGAMSDLAAAVKSGQSDSREILIAVRVLADKMDRQERYLEQIEQRLDQNCRRCKEAA